MCEFFSFVTDPVNHPSEYYFLDWEYRKANIDVDDADSHSHICAHFKLDEDVCNKYEYKPLTKTFVIDQINSERDDSEAAEKRANRLDFKEIVEPLIIKPIVNPLELSKVDKPTEEQIGWLTEWSSVGASVGSSIWSSVGASVGASVGSSVRASVWASVWASIWSSVGASVYAYVSSFFVIEYQYDFSPAIKLWEAGLVPSFDGKTWRLHSGKNADVVYKWQARNG
jgi:hypothetical protein